MLILVALALVVGAVQPCVPGAEGAPDRHRYGVRADDIGDHVLDLFGSSIPFRRYGRRRQSAFAAWNWRGHPCRRRPGARERGQHLDDRIGRRALGVADRRHARPPFSRRGGRRARTGAWHGVWNSGSGRRPGDLYRKRRRRPAVDPRRPRRFLRCRRSPCSGRDCHAAASAHVEAVSPGVRTLARRSSAGWIADGLDGRQVLRALRLLSPYGWIEAAFGPGSVDRKSVKDGRARAAIGYPKPFLILRRSSGAADYRLASAGMAPRRDRLKEGRQQKTGNCLVV